MKINTFSFLIVVLTTSAIHAQVKKDKPIEEVLKMALPAMSVDASIKKPKASSEPKKDGSVDCTNRGSIFRTEVVKALRKGGEFGENAHKVKIEGDTGWALGEAPKDKPSIQIKHPKGLIAYRYFGGKTLYFDLVWNSCDKLIKVKDITSEFAEELEWVVPPEDKPIKPTEDQAGK